MQIATLYELICQEETGDSSGQTHLGIMFALNFFIKPDKIRFLKKYHTE